MSRRELARRVHLIPHHVLAAALTQWRPFNGHGEVRREFAAWIIAQRCDFASWQQAWNACAGASPARPGAIQLVIVCPDCHGRMFTITHGIARACPRCHGRRRIQFRTTAVWQQPPDDTP
ncbi:hypothetical protein [Mycobacterium hubeiense]|uniref:hypothetical protein n=1 Tax=Mycobacterium hubeiense TaxID=1867256 RepID=UPI000C7ED42A|nr:hypothetical protein [Mycobacterium sp. QGD 101]